MNRYLLVILLSSFAFSGLTQPYSNEWIDYNKTYYKFPVASEGLFRISKTTLAAANLGDVNARDFQLWRDGKEQPVYTSEASGPLSANGYIEFYGRPLDGSQDVELFPNPDFHVTKETSFFSDTAWYFLTVNSATPNLRFVNEDNNVGTTPLAADSFFMYTNSTDFFRGGFSYNYNLGYGITPEKLPSQLVVRSSIWDQGEGFASTPFDKNGLSINFPAMQAFKNGPAMKLFTSVVGAWSYTRNISVAMNDSVVWTVNVPNFLLKKTTISNIPMSRVINDAMVIKYKSDVDTWPEKSQVNALYLTYPRKFSFNNLSVFAFNLSAASNGNHLRIGQFHAGTQPAILLDLTNLKRYTAVTKGSDSALLSIKPSATERSLVLTNQADNLKQISPASITAIQFTDYSKSENQGDYLIITSDRIRMYNGTDMVEAYKQYRSSTEGGGYHVKVINIEELYDQFALGVRKNPLSVRHFAQFAVNKFSSKPKYVLLLGRGVDYLSDRYSGNYFGREFLNSVPSWGSPCSDNLLLAAPGLDPTPLIPVGRVAVTSGKEIFDYLEKVKQYEHLLANNDFTPENKNWKKQAVQMVGGDDTYFAALLGNFMTSYKKIITDSLIGASVTSYVKANNPNYASDVKDMTERIDNGVGLINYFGHSSPTSIDFNLASTDDFTNTSGKYPVFIANGCQAGNIFFLNPNRLSYYGLSISDRFVLAPNKGAIAFISNSDYGIYNYLNLYTQQWLKNASRSNYGKGLGVIQQSATNTSISVTGTTDFVNRMNCEQSVLHGDPAVAMFSYNKPDYTVTEKLVEISPLNATVAEDSLNIKISFLNLAKAVYDSVWVDIHRELPDGSVKTVGKYVLRNLINKDSLLVKIPVKGLFDKGTNYIIATIDPAGEIDEMSETNNTARVPFEVRDDEIRPVYPYAFSIINHPGFHLKGNTVNAVEGSQTYRLQVDTTDLFNSPLLYTKDTTVIGGVVDYEPLINWQNGTVYFWRLAPVFSGNPVNWKSSSFQYLLGSFPGWGQSHFFQYTKSTFKKISPDSSSRSFKFGAKTQNIYIVNSVYGYSGDEDNHFSVSVNGLTDIYSACVGRSLIFNVFDSLTLKPWTNYDQRFGSAAFCDWGRQYNFEFEYGSTANRKKIMDFMDSIPKGMIVAVRNIVADPYDSGYVKYWKNDTLTFGKGKSLYHSLYNQGFYSLDSIYKTRAFGFVFKKDDSLSLKPGSRYSDGLYDRLHASFFVNTTDTAGEISSPKFGPAASWSQLSWKGHQPPVEHQSGALVQLIGIDNANKETILRTYLPKQWENNISDIDATQYPYLKLKLITENDLKAVPYQLDYWKLFYQPIPEGALSARDHFVFNSPVMITGKNNLHIELAFKNISDAWLDSSSLRITIASRDGGQQVFDRPKLKPLNPDDTAIIAFDLATASLLGKYYAFIQVNRENAPLEQYQFNNSTYIPFDVNSVLPITLLDFTAKAEKTAVVLNWKVTNETDVATYIVEHSDAKSKSFVGIGNVAAKNLGRNQDYTLLDDNPSEGANYYRIKTIYKAGNAEYSPVRQVYFSSEGKISVYPNPFSQAVYINTSATTPWQVEMFTAQGQRILIKNGTGSTFINTASLPAGTYLVKLTDQKGTSSLKLEKQK